MDKSEHMKYRILSLFTGGGGMDLGFEAAGFETVTCVDIDPESCKTIRRNRPDWQMFEGDIRNFNPTVEYDLVVGGPPCQGFSTAGKGNPDDPRNFLWREYFRIVNAVRPKALVLENVSGMANQKNRHHLEAFVSRLMTIGYKVTWGVLNAADFGVPQNRRRLIVLAGLNWQPSLPSPSHPKNKVSAKEAIHDLLDSSAAPNHEPNNHAAHVVERWSRLKEGESDPNYRRSKIWADRPSPTIRAGGGYGPNGDHLAGFHPPIHYSVPRQLTVRESARLQSFPDEWVFMGSKSAQGRQVGNAVAPRFAHAIALQLQKGLNGQLGGDFAQSYTDCAQSQTKFCQYSLPLFD
jgi:DNA (cytosine-5)-methyltransferase 1